jgi:hypothetical protein
VRITWCALVTAASLTPGCRAPHSVPWTFDLGARVDGTTLRSVVACIRPGSCSDAMPARCVYEQSFTWDPATSTLVGDGRSAPPPMAAGAYAVSIVARDDRCVAIASDCVDAIYPEQAEEAVHLVLEPTAASCTCASDRCLGDGECDDDTAVRSVSLGLLASAMHDVHVGAMVLGGGRQFLAGQTAGDLCGTPGFLQPYRAFAAELSPTTPSACGPWLAIPGADHSHGAPSSWSLAAAYADPPGQSPLLFVAGGFHGAFTTGGPLSYGATVNDGYLMPVILAPGAAGELVRPHSIGGSGADPGVLAVAASPRMAFAAASLAPSGDCLVDESMPIACSAGGASDAHVLACPHYLPGAPTWTWPVAGTGDDFVLTLLVLPGGGATHIVVGGSFGQTVTLQGGTMLTATGGQDAFLAGISESGETQWAVTRSTARNDAITALTLAPDGTIWAAALADNDDLTLLHYTIGGEPMGAPVSIGDASSTISLLTSMAWLDDELYVAGAFTGTLPFGEDVFARGTDAFVARADIGDGCFAPMAVVVSARESGWWDAEAIVGLSASDGALHGAGQAVGGATLYVTGTPGTRDVATAGLDGFVLRIEP